MGPFHCWKITMAWGSMLENPSGHLQLEIDKKDELWFPSWCSKWLLKWLQGCKSNFKKEFEDTVFIEFLFFGWTGCFSFSWISSPFPTHDVWLLFQVSSLFVAFRSWSHGFKALYNLGPAKTLEKPCGSSRLIKGPYPKNSDDHFPLGVFGKHPIYSNLPSRTFKAWRIHQTTTICLKLIIIHQTRYQLGRKEAAFAWGFRWLILRESCHQSKRCWKPQAHPFSVNVSAIRVFFSVASFKESTWSCGAQTLDERKKDALDVQRLMNKHGNDWNTIWKLVDGILPCYIVWESDGKLNTMNLHCCIFKEKSWEIRFSIFSLLAGSFRSLWNGVSLGGSAKMASLRSTWTMRLLICVKFSVETI